MNAEVVSPVVGKSTPDKHSLPVKSGIPDAGPDAFIITTDAPATPAVVKAEEVDVLPPPEVLKPSPEIEALAGALLAESPNEIEVGKDVDGAVLPIRAALEAAKKAEGLSYVYSGKCAQFHWRIGEALSKIRNVLAPKKQWYSWYTTNGFDAAQVSKDLRLFESCTNISYLDGITLEGAYDRYVKGKRTKGEDAFQPQPKVKGKKASKNGQPAQPSKEGEKAQESGITGSGSNKAPEAEKATPKGSTFNRWSKKEYKDEKGENRIATPFELLRDYVCQDLISIVEALPDVQWFKEDKTAWLTCAQESLENIQQIIGAIPENEEAANVEAAKA